MNPSTIVGHHWYELLAELFASMIPEIDIPLLFMQKKKKNQIFIVFHKIVINILSSMLEFKFLNRIAICCQVLDQREKNHQNSIKG